MICHFGRRTITLSLRRNVVTAAIIWLFLFLTACSGDDGSLAPRDEDSSIETSSGSNKKGDAGTGSGGMTSKSAKSSSSSRNDNSSSRVKSSSSVALAIPCKTETEDNCEYGTLIDERDGQVYKTVKIGDQWWMAENLNYRYIQPTTSLDSSSFCYKNSLEYCEKYGRIYLWSAAMDSTGGYLTNGWGCGTGWNCVPLLKEPVQGLCPSGWHLPTNFEFEKLVNYAIGGKDSAGIKLKSTSGWQKLNDDMGGNGSDAYGFSALPDDDGLKTDFWGINILSYFVEYPGDYVLALDAWTDKVSFVDYEDINPIRCLKDDSSALSENDSKNYPEESFFTDSRDGKKYRMVVIGSQTWMAENLSFETENSYCYGDQVGNCFKFGRLYRWNAAVSSCPSGWHLPKKADFETLIEFIGGNEKGKKLKTNNAWTYNCDGSDDYLFSAPPAGSMNADSSYGGAHSEVGFWSSSEVAADSAYMMILSFESHVSTWDRPKQNGYSVRCLKD